MTDFGDVDAATRKTRTRQRITIITIRGMNRDVTQLEGERISYVSSLLTTHGGYTEGELSWQCDGGRGFEETKPFV